MDTTHLTYLDFELEIGPGRGQEYPVSVVRSPAGEARETMHFPFDELALENRLLTLQNALLRSGGVFRQALSPEEQDVQRFGRDLFSALLTGEARSRYDVSQRMAAEQGKGLRLKLRIQPPELAALPWEFLYDPRQAEYVCLSRSTPVVRYLDLPQPVQPLTAAPALRILGMVASPNDLPPLDVLREKQRLERAIQGAQARGLVELAWLEGQTWRDLQRELRAGPWHIFHFIGHGGFDRPTDEGFIALAGDEGEFYRLRASQLGRLLADHRSLQLVVLNACEGARGGKLDIFSSTASILVQRGTPAVVAMQYAITDRAAIELARAFYEALAEGMPVDAALAEARKAVSLAVANSVEWGTPVLYMRSPDGVLFTPPKQRARSKKREEAQPLGPNRLAGEQAAQAEAERKASQEAERLKHEAREKAAKEEAERPAERLPAGKAERIAAEPPKVEPLAIARPEPRPRPKWAGLRRRLPLASRPAGLALVGLLGLAALVAVLVIRPGGNSQKPTSVPTTPLPAVALQGGQTPTATPQPPAAAPTRRPPTPSPTATNTPTPRPTPTSIPAPTPTLAVGSTRVREQKMVYVPGGTFEMGSTETISEEPVHSVTLDGFWIDRTEVTNAQYARCDAAGVCGRPSQSDSETRASYYGDSQYDEYPVIYVSWNDAKTYCEWTGGRLPTEAEWEYAARGPDGHVYPWGNDAPSCDKANYWAEIEMCVGDTIQVGLYPDGQNWVGALDMAGNVWEWVYDWYGSYPSEPQVNPTGPASGEGRVLRGGAWAEGSVHGALRYALDPRTADRSIGFRCVVGPGG